MRRVHVEPALLLALLLALGSTPACGPVTVVAGAGAALSAGGGGGGGGQPEPTLLGQGSLIIDRQMHGGGSSLATPDSTALILIAIPTNAVALYVSVRNTGNGLVEVLLGQPVDALDRAEYDFTFDVATAPSRVGEVAVDLTSGVGANYPDNAMGLVTLAVHQNTAGTLSAFDIFTAFDPVDGDGAEDNDTLANAGSFPFQPTFTSLTREVGDDDFYSIDHRLGGGFGILLLFAELQGDLDVTLLDTLGVVVDTSDSIGGAGRQVNASAPAGRYVVRVTSPTGSAGAYALRVQD